MGLIYDTTSGTVFQLHSVNASGVNTTQFGTSGPGAPAGGWNTAFNGLTPDGSIVWQNNGIVTTWSASTLFASIFRSSGGLPEVIYDPATKAMYVNVAHDNGGGGYLTGPQPPKFNAGNNQTTSDNQCLWQYVGTPGVLSTWQASHFYQNFVGVQSSPPSANYQAASITEPIGLNRGLPSTPPVYWQIVKTNSGNSGPSGSTPFGNTLVPVGDVLGDNGDLLWMSLGSYKWEPNFQYTAWTASGAPFSVILDQNGRFQVCISATGNSGETEPSAADWGTKYGAQTSDGDVVWTCVGTAMTWADDTIWFLPSDRKSVV
jgi:hypothetical protein